MLFPAWTGEPHRATKDLDLLALEVQFNGASGKKCSAKFAKSPLRMTASGLFADSVAAEPIRENDIYQGARVTLEARLGNARIPLQVDIGFGDIVLPKASKIIFPTLLDFPAPKVAAYPRETVIAEKFEIMVKLGVANSRMKDYDDIWALSREFDFDGGLLTDAIRATFLQAQDCVAR